MCLSDVELVSNHLLQRYNKTAAWSCLMNRMDVAVVHNIYFLLFLLSSMGFFDFLLESLTIFTISQIFHHQTIYKNNLWNTVYFGTVSNSFIWFWISAKESYRQCSQDSNLRQDQLHCNNVYTAEMHEVNKAPPKLSMKMVCK